MKKPDTCNECKFFAWKQIIGNYCAVNENITFHAVLDGLNVCYERNGECPIIDVPTPHGRLIDEKQIPYIDLNADMPQSKVRVWTTFKDKIDRLPAIIEAEEGGKR